MEYPSQDDLLLPDMPPRWIDEHFLRPDPYAFREAGFRSVVHLIAEELDVDPNGIYCIGSGAIGISLNPKKVQKGLLKRFDGGSDLDLAIISEVHFEQAWRDLRKAAHPDLGAMDELVSDNLSWQKKKFFDGAIIANKLLPAISFGPEWMSSLIRISEHITRILGHEIDVHMWIYRDYWSLRTYLYNGIRQCREAVI